MSCNYVLSACSTADITAEQFEAREIALVCFHFIMDGKEYPDDLGKSMSFPDFYKKMTEGADTSTSQVTVGEYEEHFRKIVSTGKDILHIAFSSGLSGSAASAAAAAKNIMEEFPERKILTVDSLAASSGYGLLIDQLADMRDEGKSMEELYDWAMENRLRVHHWFFSSDLTFFIKGGRVSKTAGVFGTMLKICPLLNVDYEGRLIPRFKIRTKPAVMRRQVELMKEHAENGVNYDGKCYISNSACEEDAKAVAALVEETFPNLKGKVKIYSIGTTIGSHTGPGTVALFFFGDKRVD